MGFDELSNYASSKGALEALTKSLAIEYAKKDVRINSIAPGFVESSYAVSNGLFAIKPVILMEKILKAVSLINEVLNSFKECVLLWLDRDLNHEFYDI